MKATYFLALAAILCLLPSASYQYSTDNVLDHLNALQNIAFTVGGGNRAADSPGYNASVDYIIEQLKDANTNYTITTQPFNFSQFVLNSPSKLSQISPEAVDYTNGIQFSTMTYSGSGDATAVIQSAGDGCNEGAFSGFNTGRIAIIARGNCDFGIKAQNAQKAGAVGVVIYNYEDQGVFTGTLGESANINVPVLSTTWPIAQTWLDTVPTPTLRVVADTSLRVTFTQNVIAETNYGATDSIIVVGSHLDSVPAGPGINDNGSGSASNLEMAISFASETNYANRVRFAWFGAEELGLLGSEYYVASLVASGDIENVACNVNFDMIGSPNFMRGIYDGAGAAPEIRAGSIQIQRLFENYFNFNSLNWTLTPFSGRSDYGPFIENGVPAGGLFSGAEEVKDMDGRSLFGGLANTAYDPCYHQECDTIENISVPALDELGHAAYYSVIYLAKQENIYSWLGDPTSRRIKGSKLHRPHPVSHPYLTKF